MGPDGIECDSSVRDLELLDVGQVARLMRLSKRCVRRWLRAGLLPPAVRLGSKQRSIRWRRCDIECFLRARLLPSE
jgi:predicted DNA-binding transcriptional regulator AlpA